MQRRKRWTWRRVEEGELIPVGLSWKLFRRGLIVYLRIGRRVRRIVRISRPRWPVVGSGLAPGLSTGLICPWLSRTAGEPILLPEAFNRVERAILSVAIAFQDGLSPAIRQATKALEQFGAAYKVAGLALANQVRAANGYRWNA